MFHVGGEVFLNPRNDYDEFGGGNHTRKTKKNKGKKPLRKSDESVDDWGSLSGAGITGKLPRRVHKITLKVPCSVW